MRQAWIGGAHRRDQRLHYLRLDPVRQMARVGDVLEATPAVGDFLVLGERVGDVGEQANVLLERGGKRFRRRLPLFPSPSCSKLSVGSIGSSLPRR